MTFHSFFVFWYHSGSYFPISLVFLSARAPLQIFPFISRFLCRFGAFRFILNLEIGSSFSLAFLVGPYWPWNFSLIFQRIGEENEGNAGLNENDHEAQEEVHDDQEGSEVQEGSEAREGGTNQPPPQKTLVPVPGRRWEYLYKLVRVLEKERFWLFHWVFGEKNEVQRETREYIRKTAKESEEVDPECTFQPKISLNSQRIGKREQNIDFFERNNLWHEQKQKKLEEVRKGNEDKDLVGCTFQPNMNKKARPVNTFDATSAAEAKGKETFLRRQAQARQQKEEKEFMLSRAPSGLASPKKRPGTNITIPQPPSLNGSSNVVFHWETPLMKREPRSWLGLRSNRFIQEQGWTPKQRPKGSLSCLSKAPK